MLLRYEVTFFTSGEHAYNGAYWPVDTLMTMASRQADVHTVADIRQLGHAHNCGRQAKRPRSQ